jgi:hypothetical protein
MEFKTFLAFVSANKNGFLKTVVILSLLKSSRQTDPTVCLLEFNTLKYHYKQCHGVQLII